MFRILALLILLPTFAAADWSPRPSMFNYDAAFDFCTADPTAPDLVTVCDDALTAAFVLKREVALAVLECDTESLATCAAPFEERGMPAFAPQIAASINCDDTAVSDLPAVPLSVDHCITVTSDIMTDEGVVPFFTDLSCRPRGLDCIELLRVQSYLLAFAINDLSDSNLTDFRKQTVEDECSAPVLGTFASHECKAAGYADIWADLAQQTEQDQ